MSEQGLEQSVFEVTEARPTLGLNDSGGEQLGSVD